MTETTSGSSDKAIGLAAIFAIATVLSAVALAAFGLQYLGGNSGAQAAGSFAFAGAVVFAMLAVFSLQWFDR
ncbi:DUF7525 family protein [Haloarchaeobius sp. HRN-SO-5]|uniref:DUF7525 family protein n=1 Tax=Haloarchaeobius sp. HRN-SO-5 TaxID=3446118 RepID=UPI003EBCD5AF